MRRLAIAGALLVAGCGQSTAETRGDASACPHPSVSLPLVLVASHLDVGAGDWQSLGRNIDGLVSAPGDAAHCTPAPGGNTKYVEQDGLDGIDNSFGENLWPLIASLDSKAAGRVDQAVHSGKTSFALRVEVSGQSAWFEVGPTQSPPSWDGNDVWPTVHVAGDPPPAATDELRCGDALRSGDLGVVTLEIELKDYGPLRLRIHHARVALRLEPGAVPGGNGGVVSGILDPAEVRAGIHRITYPVVPSVCYPDWQEFDVRTIADIMLDGSNGDPAKTCDGVSIGLGFDALGAKLGDETTVPALVDPCLVDAGP